MLNSGSLAAQSVALTDQGGGIVKAVISGFTCSGVVSINWGDGCTNNNNNTIYHQYQKCGTYTVTAKCNDGTPNAPFATNTITVNHASIKIQQQAVVFTNGTCGEELDLQLQISRQTGCAGTMPPVTISGELPAGFVVAGGDYSATGNMVSVTIPANSIPDEPATRTLSLRLKPVHCANNAPSSVTLNVCGPGLGIETNTFLCSDYTTPPPPGSNNCVDQKWENLIPRVPCLVVSKTATPTAIALGGTSSFEVTVQNTGNYPASNVEVIDVFSDEFMLTASPAGTVQLSGTTYSTPIASLPGGATQTLNYTFKHDGIIPPCRSGAGIDVFINRVTAQIPACNYSSAEATAAVEVNKNGIVVTGQMGVQVNGTLPVPVGLPLSNSANPVLLTFAPNSTLFINESYTFPPGSEFRMGSGAQIVVMSSRQLRINDGSHLYSCTRLWRGILVEDNGGLWMTKSTIEDAAFAVDLADDVSRLLLLDNQFLNNFIGIRATDNGTDVHNINIHVLNGNEFRSTTPLKMTYDNGPVVQTFGFAGMDLNKIGTTLTISGSPDNRTTFDGLCFGVVSTNSSLSFTNTEWLHINQTYAYPDETPTGVRSIINDGTVKRLSVRGIVNSKGAQVNFLDCEIGVLANRTNLLVQDCNMTDVRTGIIQRNGSARSTEILSNLIRCSIFGITLENNHGPTNFNIFRNRLIFPETATPFELMGIYVNQFTGLSPFTINNNLIDLNGAQRGILLSNINGFDPDTKSFFSVSDNTVNLQHQNSYSVGYSLSNAKLGMVDNVVNGSDATATDPNFRNDGFLADLSPSLWCCNTAIQLYNGIHFISPCKADNLFSGNRFFYSLDFGLRLDENAVLGEQKNRGNQWVFNANQFQAFNASDPQLSLFYASDLFIPLQRFPAGDDWFKEQEEDDFICNNNCLPDIRFEGRNSDNIIADGTTDFKHFQEGTLWSLRYQLYQQLLSVDALSGNDAKMEQFFATQSDLPLGKLAQLDKNALDIWQNTPETTDFIQQQLVQLAILEQEMCGWDTTLSQTGFDLSSTVLVQKTNGLHAFDSIQNIANNYAHSFYTTKLAALQDLYEANETILGTATPETNEQLVNQLKIQYLYQHNPDLGAGDKQLLEAVATQCPLEGGAAVHMARGILDWSNGYVQFWPDNCAANKNGAERNTPEASANAWQVFPVPATHELRWDTQLVAPETNIVVELYNSVGQKIYQKIHLPEENTVNIKALPVGLYWISIQQNGSRQHSQVILKQ